MVLFTNGLYFRKKVCTYICVKKSCIKLLSLNETLNMCMTITLYFRVGFRHQNWIKLKGSLCPLAFTFIWVLVKLKLDVKCKRVYNICSICTRTHTINNFVHSFTSTNFICRKSECSTRITSWRIFILKCVPRLIGICVSSGLFE